MEPTSARASVRQPGPAPDCGPGRTLALLLIRAYQRLISPAFRGHCRFTPSCSEYAHDAIARHGLRGVWLAFLRLLRCHPLGSSGYDPVR